MSRFRGLMNSKKEFRLSSYDLDTTAASGSSTINVLLGDEILKSNEVSVSKSSNLTSVNYSSSTGAISFSYPSNTSESSTKLYYIYVTYQGIQKTFTINQAEDEVERTSSKWDYYDIKNISVQPTVTTEVTDHPAGPYPVVHILGGYVRVYEHYYTYYYSGRSVKGARTGITTSVGGQCSFTIPFNMNNGNLSYSISDIIDCRSLTASGTYSGSGMDIHGSWSATVVFWGDDYYSYTWSGSF